MAIQENKAWAEFKTPLKHGALLLFCKDIERLFRINPYLEIKTWEKAERRKHLIHVINNSQKQPFSLKTNIYITEIENGLRAQYDHGIKSVTTFEVYPYLDGSKLKITELYHSISPDDKSDAINKVDKSLTKWAEEIQNYLISWHRWSWFLPWNKYKQHIWLPMKPTARRITYMLIWISFVEVALIFLGTIIYFLEYR